MKYSEFKEVVETLGYCSGDESEAHVYVKDCDGLTIARVGKLHEFEMATDFVRFTTITDFSHKLSLYTFCRNLAETPLAEREEEKRYRLRIVANLGFMDDQRFLNLNIEKEEYFICSARQSEWVKTIFTESEIAQMDITGFEKVEVTE